MSPEDKKALYETQRRLSELTPKQRKLLRILAADPDHWFTRKELAARLGRRYLLRHDIQTLDKLWSEFWIDANKERVIDGLMKRGMLTRRDLGSKQIRLMGLYWSYRIAPHLADQVQVLFTPKPQPRQVQPAQKPIAVIYGSRWAKWKDKLGL